VGGESRYSGFQYPFFTISVLNPFSDLGFTFKVLLTWPYEMVLDDM